MSQINFTFLISLSIILITYLFKKVSIIDQTDGNTLVKIVMNITLPSLIITVFSNIDLSVNLIFLPLICILYGLISWLLARKIFIKLPRYNKGSLVISLLGFNIGLFAYPFVENIWGTQGLQYIAFFDMGNAVIIFGLTYIVASFYNEQKAEYSIKTIFKKLIRFIPLMSYFLALILSLTNINISNTIIYSILEKFATINGPLVLMILGLYLDFSLERSEIKGIFRVISFKYIFGLLIGISLYYILPFEKLYRAVILISLIMPTGMAVIPYSLENNLNLKLSASIVNLTNIMSFTLLWVVFNFLSI
ncbi:MULTISPECIES: AEC family transporter [Halanaerobium]|uniref:Malonate transporter n=1 Tax=Halanaerobium kushneri TaxID=56779 RepID=A0A1N6XHW2_9FIRM|nr:MULTISPECIES: AEC family transporter [Halanaerobium]RCW49812.1 hypothetical protein DFR80_1534 [Halanaerobium sp. ST460_2HS_T2]SIR01924.1 hypothetical protein SAMN05421834_11196 [Halanaerobium kushneri]